MLLINLFSSLLLASTIYATICPNYWWPLNPNFRFVNDVIGGNNIVHYQRVISAPDRLGTTAISAPLTGNANAAYFTGTYIGGAYVINTFAGLGSQGNGAALILNLQQTSYAQLPPAAYFSGTAFTITFWINQIGTISTGLAATSTALRILDFSIQSMQSATRTSFGVALTNSRAVIFYGSTAGAIDVFSSPQSGTLVPARGAWAYVALSCAVGSANTVCSIYVSTSTTIGTATSSTLTGVLPNTGIYYYNFIGASTFTLAANLESDMNTHLSDLKIFNSALTSNQLQTQLTAEAAARTYTCSSTSISPQYFYIVLLALLGSFL